MQMYDNLAAADTTYGGCCTLDDLADARRVAWKLDIPHFVLNLESQFREMVITPFVTGYVRGNTPSPCVLCNTHVKWGALVLVVLAGVPGVVTNITQARTQAGESATAIARAGRPGDIVALCPDQLGPSLLRDLPKGFVVGSYPTFSDPRTVDWVDYEARTAAATPEQFAAQVLAKAGPNHRIFLVWMGTYVTHKGLCERVVNGIQRERPDAHSIVTADRTFYEAENVMEFGPTDGK